MEKGLTKGAQDRKSLEHDAFGRAKPLTVTHDTLKLGKLHAAEPKIGQLTFKERGVPSSARMPRATRSRKCRRSQPTDMIA